MKVIIEINDDTQFLHIIETSNERTIKSRLQMLNISDLEIVHESCDDCYYSGEIHGGESICPYCNKYKLWEA